MAGAAFFIGCSFLECNVNKSSGIKRKKDFVFNVYLLILIVALLSTACGKGRDKTPPTVTITTPTSNSTYTSTTSPITVGGTASDNKGVVSVTWSTSNSGSGTCTVTTNWTASIPLAVGSNAIIITARDNAGNEATATLDVTLLAPVTLSGMITAPFNTAVDGDVNDVNQTYAFNDGIDPSTQSIPNPVTLGGYVNEPGSGAVGRSYGSGDVDDYYNVSLAAGDTISLYISDYESSSQDTVDLGLEVRNAADEIVAYSTGTGNSRSISKISFSGTYYVHVQALSGASNYILTIGNQQIASSSDSFSTETEFVPGQIIVRLKNQEATIASTQDLSTRASKMGMRFHRGGTGRESLMSFDQSKRLKSLKAIGVPIDRISLKAFNEKTQRKIDTLLAVKALRKRSDVESADLNYIVHAAETTPNDTYYNLQWNLPLINTPLAWDITTGNSSVIVAVVDTGVLLNHPDLAEKLTAGYDFVSDTSMSNDGNGIDSDPDDPGDESNSGTSSFHGTHVAGIIAANTGNNNGVAGIGWNTLIMPVRALGIDGGTEYDILQAVRYAAGLSNDSGTVPAKKADVINLSLGSESSSSASQDVYTLVRNAGVIVIAAAGNNSSSTPFYPASYDGVVSVSAVKIDSTLASYSNYDGNSISYGGHVDVAAPGGDDGDLNGDGYPDTIPSTCGDDSAQNIEYNYVFMAGTSMAAPHVAGVAALMKAVKSDMTPDDFDAFLIDGDLTVDVGNSGWDQNYGWGLIDAYKAVQAASGGTVPTVLKVSPTILNLGFTATSASLTVSKIGSDPISISSVTSDESWLTVTPSSLDANGLGTYLVETNRDTLAEGDYSATIAINYNSKIVTIPVAMQKYGSGVVPDEGYHYVMLVDTVTQEAIDVVSVQASNGMYYFDFYNVPRGRYEIFAGTDRDNDNYLGDAGEAFGAYQSSDQPTDIVADQDLSGLDFSTSYLVTLPTAAGINENNRKLFLRQISKTTKTVQQLVR
jgi:serine protease